MKRILNFLEKTMENYPGYEVIYLTQTGSVLHGTNTPNSDTDIKGIFLPSIEDMLKENYPEVIYACTNEDKNSNEDIDIELFSLKKFLYLLTERAELNAYDILFSMNSNFSIKETEASKILFKERKNLLVNKTLSFVGFAMSQASKYSVKGERVKELEEVLKFFESISASFTKREMKSKKLKEFRPEIQEMIKDKNFVVEIEKEEGIYLSILNRLHNYENTFGHTLKLLKNVLNNYGVRAHKAKECNGADYKAMSHALRAIYEAIELLETHRIQFPLKEAKFLKEVKLGKYSVEFVSNKMEELLAELEKAQEETSLPKSISFDINLDLRLNIAKAVYKL